MRSELGEPPGNKTLQQVVEGMDVFDRHGDKIGKVERVFFGEVSSEENEYGKGSTTAAGADMPGERSWITDLAEVFAPDDLPDTMQSRLLREGFIRLDASGLFASDRYVMPEQIASVSNDGVRLSVRRDDLLKSA
jgi:hypothetical protein